MRSAWQRNDQTGWPDIEAGQESCNHLTEPLPMLMLRRMMNISPLRAALWYAIDGPRFSI